MPARVAGSIHRPAREGSQPDHQLEVLGDEEERPHEREDGQELDDEGQAESPAPEQGEIDDGYGQHLLSAHEQRSAQQTGGQRQHRDRVDPLLSEPLDAEDEGQDRRECEHHAGQVRTRPLGIGELRKDGATQQQEHQHGRHSDQEDRTPPEVAQQHSTHQRTGGAADHEGDHPDRDRDPALVIVMEHPADQRERRGDQRGPGDAQHPAHHDQAPTRRSERGQRRSDPERRRPRHQNAAQADPVAQGSHGDEEASKQETVDVGDPEQLRTAGAQLSAQPWDGEMEQGEVHRDQQRGQRQDRQAGPLASGRTGGGHAPVGLRRR